MSAPSTDSVSAVTSVASSQMDNQVLPIFDAFLDLPHPAASTTINDRRIIIAPPQGEAFNRSKDVGVELATEKGLQRVASFCFPEFQEDLYAKEVESKKGKVETSPNSPNLNRFDIYMKDYFFSSRATGPEMAYHTFAMQLSNGQRVYGHVRRYFPGHLVAKGRVDVGRRGIRAMVLLTRASGGEKFYHSVLKTVETLSSHRHVVSKEFQFQNRPQQAFLHAIHEEHSKLSAAYISSNSNEPGSRPSSASSTFTFKALTISIPQVELGNNTFQHVDYSSFLLPHSLLMPYDQTQIVSSPILPLLRCLGISHTLRLLSALMCERRVVMVSQSTSRLAACASAVSSILAQGLLQWQHIYIPILPPTMLNYLAAPYPYLIGVTANHASKIEHVQGLGEVLVIYLDQNDLKIYNMPKPEIAVPDILNHAEVDPYVQQQQQQRFRGVAEILKMDLIELMKIDARLMKGESGGGTAVAAKSKDLLKRGLGKLKKVAKKQMEKNKMQPDPPGINGIDDEDDEEDMKQIYAFTEGFDNQIAEEEARICFAIFFLSLIGDMKTYLRPQKGSAPKFDKELFMESRMRLGDNKFSPMYPLLMHFKESQIFEMFVKARMSEIQCRKVPSANAALFSRALHLHNSNRIAFSESFIRNSVRQISAQNPGKKLMQATANVRSRAMALTSNSRPEHLVASELSKLVQHCRESASFLVEVMSVIWERLRDSKGMQWKHGYYALQMLMELILHGPLSAISEATDGIDKIRKLKFYENMRTFVMQDMRNLATSVYNLLVNRTRLFSMRRVCALRRMEMGSSSRRVQKPNRNLRCRMKFNIMHNLLRPGGTAVSPSPTADLLNAGNMPPPANSAPVQVPSPLVTKEPQGHSNDLLSMNFSAQPTSAPAAPSASNDANLVQMMGTANISNAAQPVPSVQAPAFASPAIPVQPTIVQLPLPAQTPQTPTHSAASSYNYHSPPKNPMINPVPLGLNGQAQHFQQPIQQQQPPAMVAQQTFTNASLQQTPQKQTQKSTATNNKSMFDPFA